MPKPSKKDRRNIRAVAASVVRTYPYKLRPAEKKKAITHIAKVIERDTAISAPRPRSRLSMLRRRASSTRRSMPTERVDDVRVRLRDDPFRKAQLDKLKRHGATNDEEARMLARLMADGKTRSQAVDAIAEEDALVSALAQPQAVLLSKELRRLDTQAGRRSGRAHLDAEKLADAIGTSADRVTAAVAKELSEKLRESSSLGAREALDELTRDAKDRELEKIDAIRYAETGKRQRADEKRQKADEKQRVKQEADERVAAARETRQQRHIREGKVSVKQERKGSKHDDHIEGSGIRRRRMRKISAAELNAIFGR